MELKNTFSPVNEKKMTIGGLSNANTISAIAGRFGPTPLFTTVKIPTN